MKHTRFFLSLLIALVMVVGTSCIGEPKEKWYYILDENKEWLQFDTTTPVLFVDNFGIHQSFWGAGKTCSFLEGGSFVFGIQTERSFSENCYVDKFSTHGFTLSMSLRASFAYNGDNLYVRLGETDFMFDLLHQVVFSVSLGFTHSLDKTMYDKGYSELPHINSNVLFHDSLTINGVIYPRVMELTLKDLQQYWNDFTVTNILIAKGVGLVQFRLNNGVVISRLR